MLMAITEVFISALKMTTAPKFVFLMIDLMIKLMLKNYHLTSQKLINLITLEPWLI